jgi:DNA polymerase-3 subunit epsilon
VDRYGAQYCHACEIVVQARDLLEGEFVILDSETTGLDHIDEILQIAIIDQDGNELVNSLVKVHRPDATLERSGWRDICATDIHGIHPEDLQDAPTWAELHPQITEALEGKHVVVYNAAFDLPKVEMMCEQDDLPVPAWSGERCAMLMLSQWVGEYSYRYRDYRWQRLPGGDHTALGDCLATLRVLKGLAANDTTIIYDLA